MTKTSKLMTKENILAVIMGAIALIATYVAQTSMFACTVWGFEQPRTPKSLIKID